MILYRTCQVIGRVLFPLLVDIRVTGRERVPKSGPVLVVSNHLSYTDPVVLGVACPRPIHYLAKTELYEHHPLFEWLMHRLGTVPIRRDGFAASAIRAALRLLDEGRVVGMFPEGGILTPGDLKGGVTLIAARADVAIVPVHLSGTLGMYHPAAYLARSGKVRVEFGEPFRARDVGDPRDRATYASELLRAIESHIVRETMDA